MTFTPLPVPSVITVYGATWCGPCTRLKAQLDRLEVPYVVIDVDENPHVLPALAATNGGAWIVPTVALPDGRVLVNPSAAAVARPLDSSESHDQRTTTAEGPTS